MTVVADAWEDERAPVTVKIDGDYPGARLTRFDGAFGIVRTTHRAASELVDKLRSVTAAGPKPVTITTLVTSGTLRAAAKRLPSDAPASTRGSSFK